MSWIDANIFWVLIASGALTCSMLTMALAPRWAVRFTFGEEIASASGLLIARSWGAMIFASGLMLLYAAYHPEVRLPILLYSIVGKLFFVVLILGNANFRRRAFATVLGDMTIVALLSWYMLA